MILKRPMAALGLLLSSFTVSAQAYPYRVVDLGVVPGQSALAGVTADAMSTNGEFVCGSAVWDPFVWSAATGMAALEICSGYSQGSPADVNDVGLAAGYCRGFTAGTPTIAVLWDALGNAVSLSQPGDSFSTALAINAGGTVVGNFTTMGGPQRAFSWTASSGRIELAPSAGSSSALDLNDAGQVCLVVDAAPYRLTPGQPLLPLGPIVAERINQLGQMVGVTTALELARYTDGLGWEVLPRPATVQMRTVGGLNDFGVVVGTQWLRTSVSPPRFDRIGHVWVPGLGLQRLDDWVDPAQLAKVETVSGIDDRGRIAAHGSIGPDNRALLLEPTAVQPYGTGCGTRAMAIGRPTGGDRVSLLTTGGPGGGAVVFALAPSAADIPLPGGCRLLIDASRAVTVPGQANPIGQAHVVLPLPAGVGVASVYAQVAAIDPSATLGFSLSNGVRIDVR